MTTVDSDVDEDEDGVPWQDSDDDDAPLMGMILLILIHSIHSFAHSLTSHLFVALSDDHTPRQVAKMG